MTELLYIYNISLIIIYTIAMALTLLVFFKSLDKRRKKLFLVLTLYLAFFILDNLIISLTEFVGRFEKLYNQNFMGVPFVKTIIFTINNFCQIWIIQYLKRKNLKTNHYFILLMITIWMSIIPFFPSSALQVYLYYLPNQLFLIYIAWLAKKSDTTDLPSINQRYLNWSAIICLFFGLAILVEDSYVIFNLDQYTLLYTKIQNRNFFEDIFSIAVCLLIFYDFFTNFYQLFFEEKAATTITSDKNSEPINKLFFDYYQLTDREREICQLLLAHKTNQEIADSLYLSIGTVKTHVHNIYLKMEIHKRNEIFELFSDFSNQLNYTTN